MDDLDQLTNEDLKTLFNECSESIKDVENVSDEDKLYLYQYYKQATVGNINITMPSFWDFRGKAKYNAWKSVEDTSSEISMKKYIRKTFELKK